MIRILIPALVLAYILFMIASTNAQQIPWTFIGPGTIPPSAIPTAAGDVTGPIGSNVLSNIQSYPVSSVTPASDGKMLCSSGSKWAPCPTPSPGPTPEASPTAIGSLPTCNAASLGLRGRVTNQDCTAITYAAAPLPTAGTGCNVAVYCGGAPTGTPTPGWKLD